MVYYAQSRRERVSPRQHTHNTHNRRRTEMYSPNNYKAFKVSKALRRKWDRMTDDNDHAGVILSQVQFIVKGLRKIGSPLVSEGERLEKLSEGIVADRERNGGMSFVSCALSVAYFKMALALVDVEAGSTAAMRIEKDI